MLRACMDQAAWGMHAYSITAAPVSSQVHHELHTAAMREVGLKLKQYDEPWKEEMNKKWIGWRPSPLRYMRALPLHHLPARQEHLGVHVQMEVVGRLHALDVASVGAAAAVLLHRLVLRRPLRRVPALAILAAGALFITKYATILALALLAYGAVARG